MIYASSTCQFSNPTDIDPSILSADYEYRTMVCQSTSTDPVVSTSSPQYYNPTTTIASSSDIKVYGAMSVGELIISLFLFIAILIKLGELVTRGLSAIATKKKIIGYSGGDVEVREDH